MALIFTSEEKRCLNFYKINIALVILSFLLPFKIAGFTIIGYSWLLFLLFSILTLLRNKTIHFPVVYYIPWSLYLFFYLFVDFSFLGLQTTLQYICPIIAAMAASGLTYNEKTLMRLLYYFKFFAWLLFLVELVLPQFNFGFVKYYTGNAALVMTTTLLITIIGAEFFIFRKAKNLIYLGFLILIPYIGLTRMALLMTLAVLPLNFVPMRLTSRAILVIAIIVIGGLFFYSPRVQQKMFFSGTGTLSDLGWENADFYSGGRTFIYQTLDEGFKQEPLWGMGPRSDLAALVEAGLDIREVHNDYLSVRYDYGWVGLGLLLTAFLLQIISLIRLNRKKVTRLVKIYSASALTLFIPFFGFMYTDNILKYTIFYSTIHFSIMGMIYSLSRTPELVPKKNEG